MSRNFAVAVGFLLFADLGATSGCREPLAEPVSPPITTTVVAPVSAEPSVIELSAPRVYFGKSNLVHFDVAYRFTQGRPNNIVARFGSRRPRTAA